MVGWDLFEAEFGAGGGGEEVVAEEAEEGGEREGAEESGGCGRALEGIEFGDCGAYDSYEDDVDPEQEGDVEIRAAGEVGAGEGKFLSAAE